jgi:hypothetical protein
MPIQVLFDEADFRQSHGALPASQLKRPPPPPDSGVSGPSPCGGGVDPRSTLRVQIESMGRAGSGSDWLRRSVILQIDDSVFGVVEIRCAGRLGSGRRECSERVCESLDGPNGGSDSGCGAGGVREDGIEPAIYVP